MKTKKILLLYNLLFLSFSLLLGQGKTPCDLFAQLNKDLTEVPKLFSVLEVPANKKAYDLLKNASDDFRRSEDNIKKLVEDLASSSSGFEDIINTDGGIKAWEALAKSNLEGTFRKNVDYLENISKHSAKTGKSADEIVTIAKNNENGVEQFFDELEDTPASGCWDLNPFDRGRCIEVDLGQNLPQPFKTIDRYENETGIVTSIKSIDIGAITYQTISKFKSRLNKYAQDLNDFTSYTLGNRTVGNVQNPVTLEVLQVAVHRPATGDQLGAVDEVIQFWNIPNFNISIVVKP